MKSNEFTVLDKKIDQLTDMIGNFANEVTDRFDKVDERFGGLETRMDGLETRMDGLETHMDGLETRMVSMESTQRDVVDRLTRVEGRLAAIEADIKELYSMANMPTPSFKSKTQKGRVIEIYNLVIELAKQSGVKLPHEA
jgi:archaellum component FlaC